MRMKRKVFYKKKKIEPILNIEECQKTDLNLKLEIIYLLNKLLGNKRDNLFNYLLNKLLNNLFIS